MQVYLSLLRVALFSLLIVAIGRPLTGCSKDSGPGHNDSTDTLLHHQRHDSAKFYVSFPLDSILNVPPYVIPESGSSGAWSATWIEDRIGEINIVGGSGLLIGDTTVVINVYQSGAVIPKWSVTFSGQPPYTSGGDPSDGWPQVFSFSTRQQSQYPIKIEQQGNVASIWVYKDI
jgi:hypothetical protein